MRRSSYALSLLAFGALWLLPPGGAAQDCKQGWGTVKGRIVWGGKELPPREKVKVDKDKMHCVEKEDLYDDTFVVNPKNRGLQGVFVWLADPAGGALPVHPGLKAIDKKPVVIDQPRCQFVPRRVALREGQHLIAKNSAPIMHNFHWTGDPDFNKGGNITLEQGGSKTIDDLKAQPLPLLLQCDIHGWMKGRIGVYDHPYFAITDHDGKFELKLAPAGEYRLFINHDAIGWLGGAKGRKGEPVAIKGDGVTDLGELKRGK
jgi:hypothetical protein